MPKGESRWHETSCNDCGASIPYHEDWNSIPTLCKDCREEKARQRAKWHETSCSDCGTTISYNEDWNRIPDLCKNCIEKKKRERAKWHTTTCNHCRATIKYHEDWAKVPQYCKSCNEPQHKTCAGTDCHNTIEYKVYWQDPPIYCKTCRDTWKDRSRAGYTETDEGDVRHHTWYDSQGNTRMSWDTTPGRGGRVYKPGSGHEVDQNRPIRDKGRIKKWRS